MKAVAITLLVLGITLAEARWATAEVNYPWCLVLRGNGSWNCGFISEAQCRITRIGADMCVPDPRYRRRS